MSYDELAVQVQKLFSEHQGSHDWEHTQRVLRLAEQLAHAEGADLEVVRYAALLHDIARPEEDGSHGLVDHALRGAEKARSILQTHGVPGEVIERVYHCIASHRFRNEVRPETLEAKVLFDADKLDAIGAVGVGRAFLFAGEVGAKLHDPRVDVENTRAYSEEDTAYREYLVKLRKVKDRILTTEGRRLARERHDFMVQFFARLNEEVEGKR